MKAGATRIRYGVSHYCAYRNMRKSVLVRPTCENDHGLARRRCVWDKSDPGTVTAEFAIILPVIVVIIALLLYAARMSAVSIACQDAAATVARALVVGDDTVDAAAMVRAAVGGHANVVVQESATAFTVTTSCPVLADPWHVLPAAVDGNATGVKP